MPKQAIRTFYLVKYIVEKGTVRVLLEHSCTHLLSHGVRLVLA